MAELVTTKTDELKNKLITETETAIGQPLMPGDERRLFIDALSFLFSLQNAETNAAWAGFDVEEATGAALTARGTAVGVSRTSGQYAVLMLTLQKASATTGTIPQGSVFSAGGYNFYTLQTIILNNGETLIQCAVQSELKETACNQMSLFSTWEIEDAAVEALLTGVFFGYYLQNAVEDDTENDEIFRQRVLNVLSAPSFGYTKNTWLGLCQKQNTKIVDIYAAPKKDGGGNDIAGTVEIRALKRDSDGFNTTLTNTEKAALESYLNAAEQKPLGDVVSVSLFTLKNVVFTASIYCERSRFSEISDKSGLLKQELCLLHSCKRDKTIKENFLESDIIEFFMALDGVKNIDIISDTTSGLDTSQNPAFSPVSTDSIFVWKPSNITLNFYAV